MYCRSWTWLLQLDLLTAYLVGTVLGSSVRVPLCTQAAAAASYDVGFEGSKAVSNLCNVMQGLVLQAKLLCSMLPRSATYLQFSWLSLTT